MFQFLEYRLKQIFKFFGDALTICQQSTELNVSATTNDDFKS